MIKLIIFDFDGVIITGSNDGYFTCYHKALEAVGVKLQPGVEHQRILEYWGKGHKKQLELLLKEHPEKIDKAVEAYELCYYSPVFHKKITLVNGAATTLKKLTNTYMLGIASGMIRKTLTDYITQYNIPYFAEIMSYEDVAKEEDRKPSPFMLHAIMGKLAIRPDETIFVGDAENDVIMAKEAGVMSVAVLTGHLTKAQAEKLGVNHILSDITHLPKILK